MWGVPAGPAGHSGQDHWHDPSAWQGGGGGDGWSSSHNGWHGGEWNGPRNGALKRTLEPYGLPREPKRHAGEASIDDRWVEGPNVAPPAQPRWSGPGGVGQQDRADIIQWRECTPVGRNIAGTAIVPCKTPFEGWLADRAYAANMIEDTDWFGKEDLLRICQEQGTPVGLVIDLVNTEKYYTGFMGDDRLEYKKVRIPGRQVPERGLLEEIFDRIDDFVSRRPGEYVAVHCTHGVNRTGFVVAAYLMTRAHLPQKTKAVAAFEEARGSKIDKEYLLEALERLEEGTY